MISTGTTVPNSCPHSTLFSSAFLRHPLTTSDLSGPSVRFSCFLFFATFAHSLARLLYGFAAADVAVLFRGFKQSSKESPRNVTGVRTTG